MSHTPGPWKIVRIDGELVGSIYKSKIRICAGILDDMKLQKEAEGNTYLIATAPEMLEALEALVSMVNSGEYRQEILNRADAAIRKARGK